MHGSLSCMDDISELYSVGTKLTMARLCSFSNVVHFVVGILFGYVISANFRLGIISTEYSSIDAQRIREFDSRPEKLPKKNTANVTCRSKEEPKHDSISEAERLYKQVRVLCWVTTTSDNLKTKGAAVRDTWGKRCNRLLYITDNASNASNASVIAIDVKPGREHLSDKTMKAFQYIYKHHYNDADWFLKADDDTYVVLENLRLMLSSYNNAKPLFFGQHFQTRGHDDFFSGGAGYVISKGTLMLFGTKNEYACVKNIVYEDLAFAKCLKSLGIQLVDSRDGSGKGRFHAFSPHRHLEGHYPDWYYQYDKDGNGSHGMNSLSEYSISFHYVLVKQMYELEFLIYHVHPYGVKYVERKVNPTPVPSKYNS